MCDSGVGGTRECFVRLSLGPQPQGRGTEPPVGSAGCSTVLHASRRGTRETASPSLMTSRRKKRWNCSLRTCATPRSQAMHLMPLPSAWLILLVGVYDNVFKCNWYFRRFPLTREMLWADAGLLRRAIEGGRERGEREANIKLLTLLTLLVLCVCFVWLSVRWNRCCFYNFSMCILYYVCVHVRMCICLLLHFVGLFSVTF